jgi:hypothetical protein
MVPSAFLSPGAARAARWAFGAAAALLLAGYFARQPLAVPLPDAGALGLPDLARLGLLLRVLVGLLAVNAAAWGLGRGMLTHLRARPRDGLTLPAELGLGLLALAYAVLGLAALQQLGPVTLGALLVLGAGAGAPALWRALRAGRGRLRVAREAWLAGAALLLLATPLLRAFGPDPGWDALTYHLALPERYLFENAVVVTPFSVFSVFPLTTQMLYALALAFDAAPLAGWLHLEFGVASAWLVFALARRASPRAGWLALAGLAADPLFVWELGLAYADLSACFFTLLAAAFLFEALEGRDGSGRRAWLLCGIFAGAAASVRYPSWGVPPALLALLWLPPWRGPARQHLRESLALGGAALAVLLPWLVRNAVAAGNPFAPALQSWFHAPGQEFFHPLALAQNAAFIREIGFGRSLADLIALPWNLTMRVVPGDYRAFAYPIGALYLVGLGACLLAGRRGRPPAARRLLTLSGLLTLFWFYTGQDPRYLLPALALLAVAAGIAGDSLLPRRGPGRWWLALPLLAVLQAQIPSVAGLPHAYGRGLGPRAGSLPTGEAAQRAGERLREMLSPEDRLLLVLEPRGWYFRGLDYIPYHLADGSPVLLRIHEALARGALSDLWAELGVTHVLLNADMPARMPPMYVPGYGLAELTADLRALTDHLARRAEPVLVDEGVRVYRLRAR